MINIYYNIQLMPWIGIISTKGKFVVNYVTLKNVSKLPVDKLSNSIEWYTYNNF